MINKLKTLVAIGCLALAPAAFAIPFSIKIETSNASAWGTWGLSGPGGYNTGSAFNLAPNTSVTHNRDLVVSGLYSWNINGDGDSNGWFQGAGWTVFLNGTEVGDGVDGTLWWKGAFEIDGDGRFRVVAPPPAAVSEPGTLALLGLGLLGIGFSVRRRQTEV
jgi:hypothetical protein